jgi:hypothetical protein
MQIAIPYGRSQQILEISPANLSGVYHQGAIPVAHLSIFQILSFCIIAR